MRILPRCRILGPLTLCRTRAVVFPQGLFRMQERATDAVQSGAAGLSEKRIAVHPVRTAINERPRPPSGGCSNQERKLMTVSALNFKPFERGAMRGFLDLRYHGLTIKGCRLMESNNGLWVALPQKEIEQDGSRKWIDQLYLAAPEMEHVRKLAIADLEAQGHIQTNGSQKDHGARSNRQQQNEDLSEYYNPPTDGDSDDIPF